MMEHIRQFDWCATDSNQVRFLEEDDIDNHCVTEKILRNKFYNPLNSSDSEEETNKPKINWNEVFKVQSKNEKRRRMYVPGLKNLPHFPKLSALSAQQHYQCLKVICAEYPYVLETEFMSAPSKQDRKVFEEVKETYLKEQKEFMEWAKTLWTNSHCIRALRPKPLIETVYEAEFRMRANRLQSFPKVYELAAQIRLENRNHKFTMIHKKELISVKAKDLPVIRYPQMISRQFNVMKPCAVPEPCEMHPCRFVLPSERSMSVLPLTEVHRELGQYSLEHGARRVCSENALKCLLEADRAWCLPLSVCKAIGPDGEKHNVLVVGSEFSVLREPAQTRTHRALRHLLLGAIIPESEKLKTLKESLAKAKESGNKIVTKTKESGSKINKSSLHSILEDMELSSDDEDNLFIDTQEEYDKDESDVRGKKKSTNKQTNDKKQSEATTSKTKQNGDGVKQIGLYSCTCEGTLFEKPPLRSFRKWQVKNTTTKEKYDVIVHCAHKARGETGELVIEPIPEFQIEIGASKQSAEKEKSLALSLLLRRSASLLNVRIHGASGEVITLEETYHDDSTRRSEVVEEIADVLYTTFNQLEGLIPGHYVLKHEPAHGKNALLYAPRDTGATSQLRLAFSVAHLADSDETQALRAAPRLHPALLPIHKFRKILPCAFTPFEGLLAKEPKKPVTRQKHPPNAIKSP